MVAADGHRHDISYATFELQRIDVVAKPSVDAMASVVVVVDVAEQYHLLEAIGRKPSTRRQNAESLSSSDPQADALGTIHAVAVAVRLRDEKQQRDDEVVVEAKTLYLTPDEFDAAPRRHYHYVEVVVVAVVVAD